ncbi:DNA repair protein RecN [Alicyclobacillus sp. SO9]|uniref:DNA repair protein RecN n=1 Tax=Alicyclobacillus sp. SO9 TaxID=2665646 RepID=UPI0018E85879|nr:DNA repair protein RecN [Alicyclobacillus sp. SO9]QQE76962.1 DNA repair protein RecN [Alicyclobacillus sp. SO9]
MLVEISVSRIALIESMQLHLTSGLNVFTGETGAGKSILLDAIGLLMGNRGSTDLIRKGCDSAVVEGAFEVTGTAKRRTSALLQEWGIDTDQPLVISRKLYKTGRTVCRINGSMATVHMLRELGIELIQQHGQHESQALLKPDEQLRLVDTFGGHEETRKSVLRAFEAWKTAKTNYDAAHLDEQERARRLDMLQFQMREIEDAHLVAGEEEELRQERDVLQHVEKISETLATVLHYLEGSDHSAVQQLGQATHSLTGITGYDAEIHQASELLDTAQVHLDESVRGLSAVFHRLEADPSRLEDVENRLALIRTLQRKYGPTVKAVEEYYTQIKAEYEEYVNHEEKLAQLQEHVKECYTSLIELTGTLHKARVETASELTSSLKDILRGLQMPNAEFAVQVDKRVSETGAPEFGPTGFDNVLLLFSANKGLEAKPLQKIASGGELSRTMLALKSVLANRDDVDTLIFDEIDAGVSGAAAQSVAEQLLRLASHRQVLCVTHSPQIASAGTSHYRIAKHDEEETTVTDIEGLAGEGRIKEIARLLGSDVADETASVHAQAMLKSFAPVTP